MNSLDSITKYAKNYPPLTNEVEARYGAMCARGYKPAQEKLVRHNMLYAIKVSGRWLMDARWRAHSDDIVQGAMLGLMAASEKYNGEIRFASYARKSIVWKIVAALSQYMSAPDIPEQAPMHLRRVSWAYGECLNTISNPTTGDVFDKLGGVVKRGMVEACLHSLRGDLYLDGDAGDDGGSWYDLIKGSGGDTVDGELETESTKALVLEALEHLPEKEAYVLRRYFGIGGDDPVDMTEISQELGLTRQAVSLKYLDGLKRLRGEKTTNLSHLTKSLRFFHESADVNHKLGSTIKNFPRQRFNK